MSCSPSVTCTWPSTVSQWTMGTLRDSSQPCSGVVRVHRAEVAQRFPAIQTRKVLQWAEQVVRTCCVRNPENVSGRPTLQADEQDEKPGALS